ncbi:lysozyme [Sphingomonas sp. R1]|uniref:lysozyme n=1 Tax=Sphingomonas sp. R1 TaxID=399176 RepID=UPI00222581F6|nr:lysozyme [Sphingomonas sp. R1]UYY77806.1 lysozyme [Sphingomonas sp. R1]
MPNDVKAPRKTPGRKTLASIVGALCASLLLVAMPREESGREVQVAIAPSGDATITHVRGVQYLKTYLDIVGVATACDGITRRVKPGQVYTEVQCAQMLEGELVQHALEVQICAPELWGAGRDYQRFAAISLAYNVGAPRFCGSTAAKHFRAGQWVAGCDALRMWNKAGGRVIGGLVRRRERERQACLTGLVAGLTPANLAARIAEVR